MNVILMCININNQLYTLIKSYRRYVNQSDAERKRDGAQGENLARVLPAVEAALELVHQPSDDALHAAHLRKHARPCEISVGRTHASAGNKLLTPLSSPSMISMKKKSIDQMYEPGSVAIASGYTWNTSPGPEFKTFRFSQKM